jgi:hypothetical protein
MLKMLDSEILLRLLLFLLLSMTICRTAKTTKLTLMLMLVLMITIRAMVLSPFKNWKKTNCVFSANSNTHPDSIFLA